MPYLYGASVQGIQGFIFATNRLREIAGASELVEQLCTGEFDSLLKEADPETDPDKKCEKITAAAGNIRLICPTREIAEKLVLAWPKQAMIHAPGVTVSQAVVSYEGSLTKDIMNELEERLKVQRNRPSRPPLPALMAMERSRRTGDPAVDRGKKDELRDEATRRKEQAAASDAPATLMKKLIPEDMERGTSCIPFDMDDIVGKRESSWIAVIHADGNSLGKIIQGMAEKLTTAGEDELKSAYRDFSTALDKATCQAAQDAFGNAVPCPDQESGNKDDGKYPIRPVVLGGDDLTVICRADFALDFTREFLKAFQEQTAEELKDLVGKFGLQDFKNGLTACAGISFVKKSYPFHYAIDLAESLCAHAKKKAKEIDDTNVPACLAFHKIQSSFVTDYAAIIDRELTARPAGQAGPIRLHCGPYYLEPPATSGKNHETALLLDDLLKSVRELLKEDSPKSGLRQWLAALYRDRAEADQIMDRLKQIHPGYRSLLDQASDLEQPGKENSMEYEGTCPAYDWMTVASLMGGSHDG